MKKTLLICLTIVLVLMVASSAMAKGKGKTACLVDPPANLACAIDFSAETISCSWTIRPQHMKSISTQGRLIQILP
jgi:hypothetical protein